VVVVVVVLGSGVVGRELGAGDEGREERGEEREGGRKGRGKNLTQIVLGEPNSPLLKKNQIEPRISLGSYTLIYYSPYELT
jgi:hypothetical protein